MAAGDVKDKMKRNPRSMGGKLPKAAHWPFSTVRGIHGAARARRGIKRGTHAARRRLAKEAIRRVLDEL